ncbi:unnamed protein product [Moneuplotes crassus]|uniref:Uncharacterized protein n=1 Tax=Euplotes crassus TaxID=5936 RepID=A0AAD1XBU8_EUPCR|nr:unnamed protein product [Moneuplotes crassus]
MDDSETLVKFEYEYYNEKNPVIRLYTRKNEGASWIRSKTSMDPDPKNKYNHFLYHKVNSRRFQYTFRVKTSKGNFDDPVLIRTADLDEIPDKDYHQGFPTVKNSWGIFCVKFEVRCEIGSQNDLQVSTKIRERGATGGSQYTKFKTMRKMNADEYPRNPPQDLTMFYSGVIYTDKLYLSVKEVLKKMHFKLRLHNPGLDPEDQDIYIHNPLKKTSREYGTIFDDEIYTSLFSELTARGSIDKKLVYTPYKNDDEFLRQRDEEKDRRSSREFEDHPDQYERDRSFGPEEESKYGAHNEEFYEKQEEYYPQDMDLGDEEDYMDARYNYEDKYDRDNSHPGHAQYFREESKSEEDRDQDAEELSAEDNQEVEGQNPILNLISLSANVFCASFPQTETEFASFLYHHVKGVLCISKHLIGLIILRKAICLMKMFSN